MARLPLAAILIGLLVVALLATPGAAAPIDDDVVIVYVSADGETATVARWIDLDGPAPNATTRAVAGPLGAQGVAFSDDAGRPVFHAARSDGLYDVVVPAGATALQLRADGIPGPVAGALRFVDVPSTHERLWFVFAYADGPGMGHPPRGDAWVDIDHADLLGSGLPPGFPLPDTSTYVWNEGGFTSLPTTVRFAAPDAASTLGPYAVAVALALLLSLTTMWLFARVHRGIADPTRSGSQPILAHLEELRRRAIIVVTTLVGGAVFFFTFGFRWWTFGGAGPLPGFDVPVPIPSLFGNASAQVFAWLAAQVVPANVEVIVTSPWDAVVTQLTIALGLALSVTFPVLFYQLYAFLAPGLYPKERRAVLVSVPAVVVLFVVGAAFGLLLMMPLMVTILYGFAGTLTATAFLNVADFVLLAALMATVFGLAFELPVIMALTARLGLVSSAAYRAKWRHALLAFALVAALVTDPSALTQIIVGAVLFMLYLVGIGLAWMVERRAVRAQAHAAAPTT